MPVAVLQEIVSSSEFVEWQIYLTELQLKEHTKQDRYQAQIAAEIRRSYVKEPQKIRDEDFLLMPKEQIQSNAIPSKTTWLGLLGFGKPKNKKGIKK